MAGYGALVGGSAAFAGEDQGIDFTGPGPVYALGNGVVTRRVDSGSGWPGQGAVLVYRLTSGPGAGRYVYVSEDFAPRADLKVGSRVTKGDVLGQATGSGLAPGIEVGYANANGRPLAPRPIPRAPTPLGHAFDAFVQTLSGPVTRTSGAAGRNIGADARAQGADLHAFLHNRPLAHTHLADQARPLADTVHTAKSALDVLANPTKYLEDAALYLLFLGLGFVLLYQGVRGLFGVQRRPGMVMPFGPLARVAAVAE